MRGSTFSFAVSQVPSRAEALTNCVYLHPEDHGKLALAVSGDNYAEVKHLVLSFKAHRRVKLGHVALGRPHRDQLHVGLNDELALSPFSPQGDKYYLSYLVLEVDFLSKSSRELTLEHQELVSQFAGSFLQHFFTLGQTVVMADASSRQTLKFCVTDIACMDLQSLMAGEEPATPGGTERGLLVKQTVIKVRPVRGCSVKVSGGETVGAGPAQSLISPDFNFEKMGVGGLDAEFSNIFRRAFVSRLFPPSEIAKYGTPHVKGILLYGPPGTGKTLMARQIGQMLNCEDIQIVNGPEILDKYVGESEAKVRALFAKAEEEYKAMGDESELHIIIFDEIDAICKQRGSRNTGTGVGDTVVNQLLAKLDGVEQLNNILVIGMTNRKELIDEALLRPGRLELHLEIGLPDRDGRLQILRIHTGRMAEHGKLGGDVDLEALADRTKNYSGAEIQGLVKAASSWAMNEVVDAANLGEVRITEAPPLCMRHFVNALRELVPAFGMDDASFETCAPNGIIDFSPAFSHLMQTAGTFVEQVRNSDRTPLLTVLLEGPTGCGKTALAATLAQRSEYPFVKLIQPSALVGFSEAQRCERIHKVFEDATRSPLSVVVVDDIERLLDYVPIGPRFSNTILQVLMVLLKTPPPKGRKLMVFVTTSNLRVLEHMDLLHCFNATLSIPLVESAEQMVAVLAELDIFSASELKAVARGFKGSIPVKRLLMVAEMAREAGRDGDIVDAFVQAMQEHSGSPKGSYRDDIF